MKIGNGRPVGKMAAARTVPIFLVGGTLGPEGQRVSPSREEGMDGLTRRPEIWIIDHLESLAGDAGDLG
jgi:hypothetical protein